MNRSSHALSIGMLSLLFIVSALPAMAIGISPPEVVSPNALNGVPQTKSIRVSRNPLDTGDLHITVSAKGEYAQYLSYEPEFVIPDGDISYDYAFDVAPTTAAPGTYVIPLFFILETPTEKVAFEAAGSTITTGVAARVLISVTGESVVGFEFTRLEFDPLESDVLPALVIGIQNVGNIDWKPERMELTVIDQNDPEHTIAFLVDGESFALAGAGKVTDSRIVLKESIPEGTYVAHAEFFDNGVAVGILKSIPFTVYPKGTLSQSAELISVSSKKTSYLPGENVLLSAVLKNTGQTRINGVLMTEIFKDGAYVDIARGEELEVGVSQETSFSQTVTLKDLGSYVLTSHVKFGNQKTLAKDVVVTVEVPKIVEAANTTSGIAALSGAILSAVAVFVAFRKIRSKLAARRKKSVATPPVATAVDAREIAAEPPLPNPTSASPEQPTKW